MSGMSGGINPSSALVIHKARANPNAAPMNVNNMLSAASWRSRRPRLAPRERRTAISFWRSVERVKRRLATLMQQMRKTKATAPNKSRSRVLDLRAEGAK
jgi:hypothetical protein